MNITTFYKSIVSIILLIGILISCIQQERWMRNVKINEVEFEKVRYSFKDRDTIAIIGFMKKNNEIQGYPCKKGWVHFTKDKKLELFCLSKPYVIENISLPKESWIINIQNDKFTTVVLPNDATIQELPVKGGKGVKGTRTIFYKNGDLKSFSPNQNFIKNGIKFKKSMLRPIQISSNKEITQN